MGNERAGLFPVIHPMQKPADLAPTMRRGGSSGFNPCTLSGLENGEAVFDESADSFRGTEILEETVGLGRVGTFELRRRIDDGRLAEFGETGENFYIWVRFSIACIDDAHRYLAARDEAQCGADILGLG